MNHRDRHNRAAHCMQAGVKLELARRGVADGEHIQARIGINMALREHSSLVSLLLAKGLITEEEYFEAIANGMEEEVRMYERILVPPGSKSTITLVGAFGSIHDDEVVS